MTLIELIIIRVELFTLQVNFIFEIGGLHLHHELKGTSMAFALRLNLYLSSILLTQLLAYGKSETYAFLINISSSLQFAKSTEQIFSLFLFDSLTIINDFNI